jgi:hypothetical protein
MYNNFEYDAICNKPFVVISILTEFRLLEMNCHLYALAMEVTRSCEMSVHFYQTTWRHILEENFQ